MVGGGVFVTLISCECGSDKDKTAGQMPIACLSYKHPSVAASKKMPICIGRHEGGTKVVDRRAQMHGGRTWQT